MWAERVCTMGILGVFGRRAGVRYQEVAPRVRVLQACGCLDFGGGGTLIYGSRHCWGACCSAGVRRGEGGGSLGRRALVFRKGGVDARAHLLDLAPARRFPRSLATCFGQSVAAS